jgi:hypothetical protein
MNPDAVFVTTVAMPLALRAELDVLKALRAARSGKRPSTRQLMVEALTSFIQQERGHRRSP